MANITKRKDGYYIRVFVGRDLNGKQIYRSRTYTPEPGMTARQIEKEVNRQATLFEEAVTSGQYYDPTVTFAEFAEKWLSSYGKTQLRATTYRNYRDRLQRINEAFGHIKIGKLQPHHLISFYENLAEEGVKQNGRYRGKENKITELLKENHLTREVFARQAGISVGTLRKATNGEAVNEKSARAIAAALGIRPDRLFDKVSADEGLSGATISYYHHVISSILTTAVQWQVIPYNPAERVKPPKVKHTEAEYLEEAESVRLLACLAEEPPIYKALITTLIYTGMRRGEAMGLQWRCIDFDAGTVDINKTRLYIRGTGVIEDEPKNETSKRVISVPAAALDELKAWRAEQLREKLKCGAAWHETGYVFTGWDGQPMHPDTPSKWFRDFLQRNDLPPIHLHSLRHTNASLLIANGIDIKTVSKRLGHSNVQTTGVIYTHQIRSADAIASEQLDAILSKKA